jgi:hypothetical protein
MFSRSIPQLSLLQQSSFLHSQLRYITWHLMIAPQKATRELTNLGLVFGPSPLNMTDHASVD